jgi:sugar lactone lactonase YvrE
MRYPSIQQLVMPALGWVVLAAGCQSTPQANTGVLFFPSPPETPRIQFLTWASGADQVEPPRGTFEKFVLGEQIRGRRAINKPYGVAVFEGVAYVCDTKGLCLCRLDFQSESFSVLGAAGPGRLRKPVNIVIDPLGYKFVVDPVRKQVVVFGPDDEYVTAFDVPEPCRPVDLALYENEVFVLDNDETCQIVVLDRTSGEVLRTFGGPGGGPGQFKIPNSLCIDPEGHLYVSDTHNWRIQKLTREGESIWVKGTPGRMLGQFGRPRGIRTGPDGIVYVVDGASEIVQMFDSAGRTLMRFAGPGDAPGALALPSSLAVDTSCLSLPSFQRHLHPDFQAQYLLFVISQYGQRLVNVYAFGSFPEGYRLAESEIATLPAPQDDEGIGPVDQDIEAPEPGPADEDPAADEPDLPLEQD